MPRSHALGLQASTRAWLNQCEWQMPFSVTLTLRQCVTPSERKVWLSDAAASQNLRHFLNKLDRSIFGKASQRFGKQVGCFPVLEGSNRKRFHYHAIIDCPRMDLIDQFPQIIAGNWRSTMWGYHQVCCEPMRNDGWLSYITKLRDKSDFADAIDWMNVRQP